MYFKCCSIKLLGFNILFEPIIIASSLVYIYIFILKPGLVCNLGLFVLIKNIK